jgi:hypothetical protein
MERVFVVLVVAMVVAVAADPIALAPSNWNVLYDGYGQVWHCPPPKYFQVLTTSVFIFGGHVPVDVGDVECQRNGVVPAPEERCGYERSAHPLAG